MKKRIIFTILCFVLFLLFTILVIGNYCKPMDDFLYQSIYSIRNRGWDFLMKSITICGNTPSILIVLGIFLVFLPKKEKILSLIIAGSSVGSNTLLKRIIRRTRPEHLRLIKQGGFSYPSGHAMIAVAVYGFFIYYILEKIKDKKWRIGLISFFTLLIIGIGISRIYLGVHYPSDILGGYFLSLGIELFIIHLSRGDRHDKNDSK